MIVEVNEWENWMLVTNELVEVRYNQLKFETARSLPQIFLKFNKENLKDVNMQPVGLGATRISTDQNR
jgi:hypothetical protein